MRSSHVYCQLLAIVVISGVVLGYRRLEAQESAIAKAMTAMFNPGSAPDANTMGLLQRSNFIDRVANASGRFELVFVVDATESMESQLSGIQLRLESMLEDIRRIAGDEVYAQIVLYRDLGAADGVVNWPLGHQSFTRDIEAIRSGLQHVVPESGAPYFLEAVDQGVFEALTRLSWSEDANATKWLFLIGDAPPYDRGFNEPATGASRKHSTEQLVQLAQQVGVEINAILCPTREADQVIYEEVIGSTRFFFDQLSSQTGGWMLDLSDPKLLESVARAAEDAVSNFVKIAPITRAELNAVRQNANRSDAVLSPERRVRIAVLPHLGIKEMNFSRRDPAVRFADEMRSQLEMVGADVEVVSSYELKRTFNKLQPLQGMQRNSALQQIGRTVAADYVLWGAMVNGQPDKVQSGLLDTSSGKFVVSIPTISTEFPPRASLCSTVLDALAAEAKRAGTPSALARFQRKFRTRLVAESEELERLLIRARTSIWDAMQLELGQENSAALFDAAEADLKLAITLDRDNPITNSLLANVYFSQYLMLQSGDDPAAKAKRRAAINFASDAIKGLNRALESDQLEIEADYHFYRGDFEEARKLYLSMVERSDTLSQAQRARWMLIGIYSGDWGIDQEQPELIDAAMAREYIVQLLALFEDGPQAKLLRKYLVWDEIRGGTLNPNVPRPHSGLASSQ